MGRCDVIVNAAPAQPGPDLQRPLAASRCRAYEGLRKPVVGLQTRTGKIPDDLYDQVAGMPPASELASEFELRVFAPGQQPNGCIADHGPALVSPVHDLPDD